MSQANAACAMTAIGDLSMPDFFVALKRAEPAVLHFIVQRQEPPKPHLVHLCVRLDHGGIQWFTGLYEPSQAILDAVSAR